MAWIGGRAPPSQKKPTPFARIHLAGEDRAPHAPAPLSAPARRWSAQPAAPDRVPPGAPSCATSPLCSQSSPQSSRSPPIARRDPPRAPAPSAPHASVPQPNTCLPSLLCPWLQPLKVQSLRQTRRGSIAIVLLVGFYRLRIPYDDLLGVASGVTGNPAILIYAARMAPTDRADIGYAMIFPSATIIKVIAVQVVGIALLGH